jgi:hypothetical protein
MKTIALTPEVDMAPQKPEANRAMGRAVQALRDSFAHQPAPEAVPSAFLLGTLRHRRFRVTTGIPVEVARDGDTLVLCAVPIEEYGYGANFAEAVEDLQRTIVELFLGLRRDETRLGPDLRRIYANVREYVTDATL